MLSPRHGEKKADPKKQLLPLWSEKWELNIYQGGSSCFCHRSFYIYLTIAHF